jgi:hypothetical protein
MEKLLYIERKSSGDGFAALLALRHCNPIALMLQQSA